MGSIIFMNKVVALQSPKQNAKAHYGILNLEKRKYPRFSVDLPVEYCRVESSIGNEGAYSDALWPLIPIQVGHPFRSKLATYSDPKWPVVPIQSGHL